MRVPSVYLQLSEDVHRSGADLDDPLATWLGPKGPFPFLLRTSPPARNVGPVYAPTNRHGSLATSVMGWAACFRFQHCPTTYHLFLTSTHRSACRRIDAQNAITAFYPDVPDDGHPCTDCRAAADHLGSLSHAAIDTGPLTVPLFVGRRAQQLASALHVRTVAR